MIIRPSFFPSCIHRCRNITSPRITPYFCSWHNNYDMTTLIRIRINVSRHNKITFVGIILRLRQGNRLPIFRIIPPCPRHLIGFSFHSRREIGTAEYIFKCLLYAIITIRILCSIQPVNRRYSILGCILNCCCSRPCSLSSTRVISATCRPSSGWTGGSAGTSGRTTIVSTSASA